MTFLYFVLILVTALRLYFYVYESLCGLSGHDFEDRGKSFICRKCNAIKRKVRK